jgi:CHAT domain-containing protein
LRKPLPGFVQQRLVIKVDVSRLSQRLADVKGGVDETLDALLVSHCPVVSDAAVALTTRMLASANKGIIRADAQQQAMMALINADPACNAHPAIWAPFVLAGEGGR